VNTIGREMYKSYKRMDLNAKETNEKSKRNGGINHFPWAWGYARTRK